jgi:hypothetical protein
VATRTGDIKSQQDLVNHLFAMRTGAVYDLFGQILLHNFFKDVAAGKADASTLVATLPEGTLSLQDFVVLHDRISDTALRETKRNANRALTRNLFKETFRLTLSYCNYSNQKEAIKSEHWFEFARVVANSLSHNFRLDFRPYDLSVLPVMYGGVTIDASMNGKTIEGTIETLITPLYPLSVRLKQPLPKETAPRFAPRPLSVSFSQIELLAKPISDFRELCLTLDV